ncbi:AhpC/TSA family protein [Mucilaginibacter rubeus]|jgi:peroxiredoxin|uniref:AhpC/TSA family protein n=1 Tax=Mucilaginibacter rubeus TaxID=2027860 RepID=A0AAE6JEI3_9SPHI|nr:MULTISPECIES: TlpA disulfide reductase family protein [Mucilaginibacter]QEM03615.1 AhpC/TSA family protein [Mucilaginibacter rubeus]QEM16226.1 AhpC/TSA family protein [Mucilaginibacter gossypii]QTE41016.1 AhpC/TSA family protein [Mucilaginibacter rubeus]QTE47619.1 AhpC/TSA family protein [Mucilaginibacter rubeus]QTE59010.1 AhpC/TSA family protein [Mucilaginibacter rubeus]
MKKLLNLILSMAALNAAGQTNQFAINGQIGNLNGQKVYLSFMTDGKGHEDSTTLVNGAFHFTGRMNPYSSVRLALDHKGAGREIATHGGDILYFNFSNETLNIVSKDSLANAQMSGSKTYDEYSAYVKAVGPMPWDIDHISNAEIAAAPELVNDTAFTNSVARHHYKMIADFQRKNLDFAKTHPDSFFAPVALFGTASNEKTVTVAEQVFKTFSPAIQATDNGKTIKEFIDAHYRLKIGGPAPVFTQVNPAGKRLSLADYKGKIVLVDFWASWCSPCRQEIPNLLSQYKMYKDKGFEILSVSLDNSRDKWLKALQQEGMTWPQVSDLNGNNNSVARLYGVSAIPATFLVDRDGKLISTNLRGEDLNHKLAELFN